MLRPLPLALVSLCACASHTGEAVAPALEPAVAAPAEVAAPEATPEEPTETAATVANPRTRGERDLVYLLMVDRFADGNEWNNGSFDPGDPQAFHGGDLQGVRQRLDHLDELGVGTVWLTPVFDTRTEPFASWGAFHGYWLHDPTEVEERFGSEEELRALASDLHNRGMKLMLDMVYNHVAPEHPWLEEHPEWFHPDRTIEDWDDPEQVRTGWVHGLPDLNQDHPGVRQLFFESTLHWVESLHLDGIRIDAVRHMDPAFIRQLVTSVEAAAGRDLWVVGEDFSGDPAVLAATLADTGVDAVFDFPLRYALTDVFCKGAPVGRLGATLSLDRLYTDPNEQLVGFLDNHDLPRIASECGAGGGGPAELHQALAVLLSVRGHPSITWGTELPLFGAGEPSNRGDYDWSQEAELGATIAEFAKARRGRVSLQQGRDWIFHLDEHSLGIARVTPDEAAVIVINRDDEQATVRLPDVLRFGARERTFHEVVGNQGPFLRHQAVEPPGPGQRPRVRHFTLFSNSVMVGYLEPDQPGGYEGLLGQIEAWSSQNRLVRVRVYPGPGTPGPTGAPAENPGSIDASTAEMPALEAGSQLLLVGADPELGHWELDQAVRLYPQPDGSWRSGLMALPLWSVAEYKLAARTEHGDVWESGPNRYLLVEPGEDELEVDITLMAPSR